MPRPSARDALAARHAWRSAPCTGRRSSCRSPRRATSRWCPGCWTGPTRGWTPELRKAFEVALHAGTAAALVVALRDEVADAVLELDGRRGALILLSSLPPARARCCSSGRSSAGWGRR